VTEQVQAAPAPKKVSALARRIAADEAAKAAGKAPDRVSALQRHIAAVKANAAAAESAK
jgi:hypothetical protein